MAVDRFLKEKKTEKTKAEDWVKSLGNTDKPICIIGEVASFAKNMSLDEFLDLVVDLASTLESERKANRRIMGEEKA